MDVMRTISSILGVLEPETKKNTQLDISLRLIALFGPALLYWYHFSRSGIRINGQTGPNDSIALNFLKLYHLTDKVEPLLVRAFDVSLILYAEHEYNASTFAARVTVSTMSDFYSGIIQTSYYKKGITSAIGTLRGTLHGGANEAAMAFLAPLQTIQDADKFINHQFQNKKLIMGFGHRVYKKEDPRFIHLYIDRSPIIKKYSILLTDGPYGNKTLLDVSQHIEKRILNEKKMFANLDFYSASAYNQCGYSHFINSISIDTSLFTPIFVISRTTGWAAHIIEQRSNNKLIRPISHYTGPDPLKFVPIQSRIALPKL